MIILDPWYLLVYNIWVFNGFNDNYPWFHDMCWLNISNNQVIMVLNGRIILHSRGFRGPWYLVAYNLPIHQSGKSHHIPLLAAIINSMILPSDSSSSLQPPIWCYESHQSIDIPWPIPIIFPYRLYQVLTSYINFLWILSTVVSI